VVGEGEYADSDCQSIVGSEQGERYKAPPVKRIKEDKNRLSQPHNLTKGRFRVILLAVGRQLQEKKKLKASPRKP